MNIISQEHKFLFDLQGFLLLPGVLQADECAAFFAAPTKLEAQKFADERARNAREYVIADD